MPRSFRHAACALLLLALGACSSTPTPTPALSPALEEDADTHPDDHPDDAVSLEQSFTLSPLRSSGLSLSTALMSQSLGTLTVTSKLTVATSGVNAGRKKASVTYTWDGPGQQLSGQVMVGVVAQRSPHPDRPTKRPTRVALGSTGHKTTVSRPEAVGDLACALNFGQLWASVGTPDRSSAPTYALDWHWMCEEWPDSVALVQKSLKGLVYLSESDHPWTLTDHGQTGTEAIQAGWGGTPVQADYAAFMARLSTSSDPSDPASVRMARRYAKLEAVLRSSFSTLELWRVPDPQNPAAIALHLLACNAGGCLTLSSVSIET